MGVGQLIRNVITVETDPTVANFTKSLTSSNTILTAVNAATGTISASVLPSYVDDVLNFANLATFPVAGETGKIYVTEDNNKTYRWSGSVYVEISSSATAGEALKLTNARTISTTGDITGSISGFDGSANVSGVMTLQTVNSDVGSFGSVSAIPVVTVNAKGQVTAVSTNSIGNELIALQALSDTPGFLKKTGDGTYLIDVNSYLSLTGGTITGDLVSTSATTSTSPTTGAIRAASLGITGAIFADTISANSYNLIPVGRGAGGVNSNTVVGVSSLLANTTGNSCSAFGVTSLRDNTTGSSCSAFGAFSLRANTTGSSCSAFGVTSLRDNTTGSSCSAFGAGSLQANTTGSSCSAFGVNALLANTTGSNCSAFGVNAGRYQSDGVTEISVTNNSCFFGRNTKGTQNATNEQVFGYNATGNGSNTVTLGDSSITNNFFRGALSLNGTQVISTRRTGWIAPTGTATRTTFATSTVTLSELAETVKALIDDLTTHGLIGA